MAEITDDLTPVCKFCGSAIHADGSCGPDCLMRPLTSGETPDFDKIGAAIAVDHLALSSAGIGFDSIGLAAQIAEQLRLVWNARGAADATLFAGEQDGHEILDRIATLDR